MTGIHLKANMLFTDYTAPVIPERLPISGAYRSFQANTLRLPVGAPVAAWLDSAGSGTSLTPGGAGALVNAPTLVETSGVRAVQFSGANQAIGQALPLAQPFTFAMIFRAYEVYPSVNNMITSLGPNFFIDSTGAWKWNPGGSMGTIPGADTAWHVVIATGNGDSSVFNLDGTEVAATGTTAYTKLVIGMRNSNEQFFRGFVTQAHIYNRALSANERGTLMAHLMSRKP